MKHAKILDCTLRDGAYLIDKNFGEYNIRGIIDGLCKSNIDYIEIGFFQNDGFGDGKTVFLNSEEVKKYIPKEKNGCEFSVLADFSRYNIENLDERTDDSIDIVRECFFKHERFEAIEVCKKIKEKGYKLFIQPVDILGYSDLELIEFINMVNTVHPYCLSIVDTFGSMYQEDLHRIFGIIHHNLDISCKIGFHSHNNMQLSNALSQEFLRITIGKREVVIDGTLSGMGRGAGNTPTELIAQYMVAKHGYSYDMDSILDTIDIYMDGIRSRCSWGYSTPGFIAGCYSAHMNNIEYLTGKSSIKSKDIRYILNKIGAIKRKRYDYDLLEETYIEYLESDINDSDNLLKLKSQIEGREVLLIAPGHSCVNQEEKILDLIKKKNLIIISINFIHDTIKSDYIFISNVRRFNYWQKSSSFNNCNKILTSNLSDCAKENDIVISYTKLLKCGWEYMDNAMILALRLMDILNPNNIYIAGFDGYGINENKKSNYINQFMELESTKINPMEINCEIDSMLRDFYETKKSKNLDINFVTSSRFDGILHKNR